MKYFVGPIMLLLLLNGLGTGKSNRKLGVTLSVIYHAFILSLLIFRGYCLTQAFSVGKILIWMGKIFSLTLWWLVHARMEKISSLIGQPCILKSSKDIRDNERILQISRIAVATVIIVTFIIPAGRTLRFFILSNAAQSCFPNFLSDYKQLRIGIHFIYEFADMHVSSTLMYAISIFYTQYCFSFSQCLKDAHLPVDQVRKLYRKSFQVFAEFEDVLSVLVFILFTVFFCKFFLMIFVFTYSFKYNEAFFITPYILYFISYLLAAIAIVLSADDIQNILNKFHRIEYIISNNSGKPKLFSALNSRHVGKCVDPEQLVLTGWGMFVVHKPLLLSMATWLFTYAAIIIQYYYTPPEWD
ncbi:hypothetical protein AVEN_74530-1 [Araneus ventricosus]|uniref:Gustatory receptor n=1 Tax=Araneus ventricosus TaxID=182803 RepID=A0A4Y2GNU1_ARAVE|nr:hypothetical protein AVEN_74530-1 [Araneus ventricosus]